MALLVLTLVVADWGTKLWVINRLGLGESHAFLDGWIYFIHRQNPGVAFSLFADMPGGWRLPLLSILSVVGIGLFTRILLTTPDRVTRIAAAVVVAGAIGNLGDRLVTGEVTDFLFVSFFPFVFNVADAAITVGGAVLAFRLARGEERIEEPITAGGVLDRGTA